MEDGSKGDRVLMRALVYLVVLVTLIGIFTGGSGSFFGNLVGLAMGSVFVHTLWFLLGAVLALSYQMIVEGYLYELWVRVHPQSAPTPEAKRGQRAEVAGFRSKRTPATLVGTSTNYLNDDLDLRTETLIRLSCLLYTSPSPRDGLLSRMPSSA